MTGAGTLTLAKQGRGEFVIGAAAVRCLHAELMLYPKPGLVSPIDNGAHDDMTAETILRSLFSLRHYFRTIAAAGAEDAPFSRLQRLGIEAERTMLTATGGINAHRGAIFCLGLLAAAAGWRMSRGLDLAADRLAGTVLERWQAGIRAAGLNPGRGHGAQVVRRYGVRGAREEAVAGFPVVTRVALPALTTTLRETGNRELAMIQCLFAIMARLEDTNLLHRGGLDGLHFVQKSARRFLDSGGVQAADWRQRALALHGDCVGLRLSPGGAADCLAAACFLHELSTLSETWA